MCLCLTVRVLTIPRGGAANAPVPARRQGYCRENHVVRAGVWFKGVACLQFCSCCFVAVATGARSAPFFWSEIPIVFVANIYAKTLDAIFNILDAVFPLFFLTTEFIHPARAHGRGWFKFPC